MSRKILALFMILALFAAAALADGEGVYTYNSAQTEFPTNWSPHQNQTQIDSDLMVQLGNGFYDFDYNEDEDGYKVIPQVAADFPVDVTADYVGDAWGIAEGEEARAWRIPLRGNLAWEDGTPITAGDFVTSAKLLLNPTAQNHRADMLYSGNLVIKNAEAYLKQGLASDTALGTIMEAESLSVEDLLAKYGSEPGCINWGNSFGDTYDFDAKAWTGEAEDAVVTTPLTLSDLYAFYTTGEGRAYATWASDEQMTEWALEELFTPYMQFAGAMDFDQVGILAPDDTSLVLILAKPLSGFYLYYSLTDYWLVNETLYHACESETDGVYNNTFGTSKETSISFGPYRLSEFQSDKTYLLEKNPNWYGWSDPANEGWYQTDAIRVDCVAEVSTRMEMFMSGLLDVVGLDKDHIGDYATSEYTYYDEGDSVFAMVFNPELSALKTAQEQAGAHINKTILTLKDFRMAMSLGLNRQEFCLASSPTNEPAFALYGGQIVADPEQGLFYRTTDVAKQVVVDFWGLSDEIGEGKLYADADEAIDSLSGYNLEMARQYFDAAYDEAIAQGLMGEDDVVEIMIGTPNETSAFYNSGYDFIVNNYTEAVKGTKLEGKLTFKRDATLGNGFGTALRNNQVDMLFGVGWTGSTFDPYGLIEAYVEDDYRYDPAWNPDETMLTCTLDGEEYTANVRTWQHAITNETVTAKKADGTDAELNVSANAEQRILVLSQLENVILQNYDFIPLMGDSSAKLKGMQVEYHTEDEVFPLSRGGIKYMTYNYDDAEWNAFVASQGGVLNYK